MSRYDDLSREDLIRLLECREQETRYGLVWERDKIEQDQALNQDFVALQLVPEQCVGGDQFTNLIIEGDNYDALRFLRMTHAGRIKCIYIDPPYNTGNRDFIYNDHFFDKNSRFRHSVWIEFMYQRLILARKLLHPEGAIFVSIDDNELFQLGMLMNRVFGEKNFITNVIWQKVYSPKNSARHFSMDHDYILVYASDADRWRPNPLPRTEAQDKIYKNPDDDPRGPWMSDNLSARNPYSRGTYPITCPSDRVIQGPPAGTYWRVSKEKFLDLDRDNRIWWGKDGNGMPRLKRFLSEVKEGRVPQTLWPYSEVGHTQEAKKEILDILEFEDSASVFSTPKPTRLIERVIRLATGPDDIVLDFFAGSGTTAHAVLKLNQEDGGNRRFILVSNAENTGDLPDQNICRDICARRMRRIIEGYTSQKGEDVAGLGGNFAYFQTVLLPRHRLPTRLDHRQIWSALQMIHDLPLSSWRQDSFAWQEDGDRAIGYNLGRPDEWASISRYEGVQAGLLKRGVKMARFIAKDAQSAKLVSFEHTALAECTRMHRSIKQELSQRGIALTPLMLVQVPNGKAAQQEAHRFLLEQCKFPEEAVRIHTADEPDADLIALTNDPEVEVLIFKMAVAMGFDAPRAWTLAALRGARDANFGTQVIGRLMRVHRLLQNRSDLPSQLQHGYVFLANEAAQEGLLNAGELINEMKTRAAELGSQTVVTYIGGEKRVQVVKDGQPLNLFVESTPEGQFLAPDISETVDNAAFQAFTQQLALPLFLSAEGAYGVSTEPVSETQDSTPEGQTAESESLFRVLTSDTKTVYQYPLQDFATRTLITERLPDIADDFEEQLAANIHLTGDVLLRPMVASQSGSKAPFCRTL